MCNRIVLFTFLLLSTANFIIAQDDKNAYFNKALDYLNKNANDLNLNANDISELRIRDLYKTQHNGLHHLYLNQQYDAIDIEGALVNFNFMPDQSILFVGNRLESDIEKRIIENNQPIEPALALLSTLKT
ncbi:MAG: hypothetical protein AAGK97_02235, partial [Bacteroidota bacterium]